MRSRYMGLHHSVSLNWLEEVLRNVPADRSSDI
jgi:hypothetical protein